MKLSRTMLGTGGLEHLADDEHEERQIALEYVAEAWNAAEDDGVTQLALAHASLFAALTALVEQHGEITAAEFIAGLPDRIRSGDYSLGRSLQ